MSTTNAIDSTTPSSPVLYLAFELGNESWKLALTIGAAQKPRIRTISARDLEALMREINEAKRRLRLPETTPVVSCYEAGRDGFWLHRFLASKKIENLVVDASSIEVNRRRRAPSPITSTIPSWWACSSVGLTGRRSSGVSSRYRVPRTKHAVSSIAR